MAVKEVLVEDGIVVSERLCEPGQSGGRDLLEGGLVGLIADPAHVQDDPVLTVHHAPGARVRGAAGSSGPATVVPSSRDIRNNTLFEMDNSLWGRFLVPGGEMPDS